MAPSDTTALRRWTAVLLAVALLLSLPVSPLVAAAAVGSPDVRTTTDVPGEPGFSQDRFSEDRGDSPPSASTWATGRP
ncbi:hypothetical protein BRC81_06680 [Halobacteriales archaeon QS_1_68_20]|nr:MAG: hypothetical protein BRC81_06680 [Halobacteriales archaeon QS_1_68_20]